MDNSLESFSFSLKTLTSINDITPEDWDRLNPSGPRFVLNGFMSALEDSKC